ncbi:D-2-hydroxyacid dehydrogenase [Paenibacillus tarimensis]
MRKMICLHGLTPDQQERVRAAAPEWELVFGRASEIEVEHYRDAEVICGWSSAIAQEALKQETALRWVQGWSAGVDKLPLDTLRQYGVILTDASGIHPHPMAETAFALMLGLTRNLHLAVRSQQSRHWNPGSSYGEMYGKTIGIIGAGEIGMEIARLAKAFGMQVLGVRRSGRPATGVDQMTGLSGLEGVLRQSDYIVNILPLTGETKGLFDAAAFNQMKSGSYYINIGRGATTDTAALVGALRSGRLAGAGLDVFDTEPLPQEHPLWELDNVILTPHIGGATTLYTERVVQLFIYNLSYYLKGEISRMRNIVDYSKSY